MANPRHTIELNGQLYDAVTGALVKTTEAAVPKRPNVQVMDGFVKHTTTPAPKPTHAKKHRVEIQTSKPAPKKNQRSATLMRSAVKKPQTATTHPAKPVLKQQHRATAHRSVRASTVSRSQQISKFGHGSHASLTAEVATLPVQAPPLPSQAPPLDLRQQIAAVTAGSGHKSASFEHALRQAESHKQQKHKKAKLSHRFAKKVHVAPRFAGIASGFAATLLIAGFFLYQNVPNLSMRVAAARAGVQASVPGYKPAGFSMSRHIQYSPGKIMISFHSNSDERAFNVVQEKSSWTSQQLVDELVAADNRAYQTYQEKDKIIYIYEGSNAAWIEEGVLYQIEGDASLSSDQLIRLATSI